MRLSGTWFVWPTTPRLARASSAGVTAARERQCHKDGFLDAVDHVVVRPAHQAGGLHHEKRIAEKFLCRESGPDTADSRKARRAPYAYAWVRPIGAQMEGDDVDFVSTFGQYAEEQVHGDGGPAFLEERVGREHKDSHGAEFPLLAICSDVARPEWGATSDRLLILLLRKRPERKSGGRCAGRMAALRGSVL